MLGASVENKLLVRVDLLKNPLPLGMGSRQLRYTKQEKDEVLKTYCESVSLLRDAVNGSQSIGSVQDPEHPDTQIDAKTWLKHGPLGDQRIRQIVFSGNIDSLLSYPSSSIRRSAARYKYGLTEAPMKDVLALMNSGTRYYRDSLRFNDLYTNTGNGYWYSKCEMFARAFDCYVLDKMKESGITDTYLSGHAESFHGIYRDMDIYAYPIGDERKQFEQAFDHLIAWAKENEII